MTARSTTGPPVRNADQRLEERKPKRPERLVVEQRAGIIDPTPAEFHAAEAEGRTRHDSARPLHIGHEIPIHHAKGKAHPRNGVGRRMLVGAWADRHPYPSV